MAPSPAAATTPAPSTPKLSGGSPTQGPACIPRRTYVSIRFRPAAFTSTTTPPGSGSGTGRSSTHSTSGDPCRHAVTNRMPSFSPCPTSKHEEWSAGPGRDQRFQQTELGVVGYVPVEIPHDVVDAEIGGSVQVVFDLVHRSRQRTAVGVVDGGFGDRVAYPDHDGTGLAADRSRRTEDRELAFEGLPIGDHGMQAEPRPAGPLYRNIRCGADSHENLEPARLQWLRADLRGRYTVKATLEADGIGPPGGLQCFDVLGETVSAAAHRYVGGFELLSGPSLSQAHDEPPAAEMIQRRQPTGEDDGYVKQGVDDAGAQADGAGVGRNVSQRLDRVEHVRVVPR